MKRASINTLVRSAFVFLLSLMGIFSWAQDSTGSSTTVTTTESTTTTTEWYTQPWVWVVGAAVFIIIIVALIRSNSSSDKTEVSRSTTVIKDRD